MLHHISLGIKARGSFTKQCHATRHVNVETIITLVFHSESATPESEKGAGAKTAQLAGTPSAFR